MTCYGVDKDNETETKMENLQFNELMVAVRVLRTQLINKYVSNNGKAAVSHMTVPILNGFTVGHQSPFRVLSTAADILLSSELRFSRQIFSVVQCLRSQ
jgi:hypothetical protein